MKKVISTIVAIGFISSTIVSSAYAGHRNIEVLNPLWVPVAILSTVATIVQAPFVYEHQRYTEPRQTVIYEEPRQYRLEPNYERGPANYYYDEHGRSYDAPRYRECR
jgi:hypothetical protein